MRSNPDRHRSCGRSTEIFVNDFDIPPTQRAQALLHGVLQFLAF
jgi:hypothetical protein